MSAKRLFVFILLTYISGFLLHAFILKKTVYGDGLYYFAWTRSIVIDGDIDFSNDYSLLGITQSTTPKGLLGNIYPIGPGVFWLPAYAWTRMLFGGDGTGLPYQLAVGLTGVFSAVVGLLLTYRAVLMYAAPPMAVLAVAGIAFATNAFFYGSLDAVNSHAVSFLLAALFLNVWGDKRRGHATLGMILGAMALVRPQDVVYGVLLLRRATPMNIAINILGFAGVYSLQLIARYVLYGTLMNPYLDRGYGFDFLHPEILPVLFSSNNGMFLWTPYAFLATTGFFLPTLFPPYIKMYFLTVLFVALLTVASWSTWWQGASFSGRMFISVLPILGIGAAQCFKYLRKFRVREREALLIFVGPLSLINAILMVFYLVTH